MAQDTFHASQLEPDFCSKNPLFKISFEWEMVCRYKGLCALCSKGKFTMFIYIVITGVFNFILTYYSCFLLTLPLFYSFIIFLNLTFVVPFLKKIGGLNTIYSGFIFTFSTILINCVLLSLFWKYIYYFLFLWWFP